MPRAPADIPPEQWTIAMARGVGPVEGRRLLQAFGDARAVLRASADDLAAVIGQAPACRVHEALHVVDVKAELRRMDDAGIRGVLPGDADWPPLLEAIPSAPLALWIRGAFTEADRFGVAVVGSRACTGYGLEQADRFAGWLAEQGFTVVSGGARGIDAAAHRVAGHAAANDGVGRWQLRPVAIGQRVDVFQEHRALRQGRAARHGLREQGPLQAGVADVDGHESHGSRAYQRAAPHPARHGLTMSASTRPRPGCGVA